MTDAPTRIDAPAPSAPMRWLLQAVAVACLVLAAVGVVLPVMPTVPFLVVAAWAASRSSPRLHAWLLAHKRFGPYLRDWSEAGVVPRRAKWFSTLMMGGSAVGMTMLTPPGWAAVLAVPAACMVLILAWLWRRPERRPGEAG